MIHHLLLLKFRENAAANITIIIQPICILLRLQKQKIIQDVVVPFYSQQWINK